MDGGPEGHGRSVKAMLLAGVGKTESPWGAARTPLRHQERADPGGRPGRGAA